MQQIDLREHNSWRMLLEEVPSVELLEVQLVNAVAPFMLNARLKPLMLPHPSATSTSSTSLLWKASSTGASRRPAIRIPTWPKRPST